MHIAFALFADAANLSQEGKLNILGVFDALQVGAIPAVHPRAHLVLRLKGGPDDAGVHHMVLSWVNPAGTELWSTSGEMTVDRPPGGVREIDFPVIAAVDLPIDQGGSYAMRVALDRTTLAEVQVHVRVGSGPVIGGATPQGMVS
jgi:hypothetical protein